MVGAFDLLAGRDLNHSNPLIHSPPSRFTYKVLFYSKSMFKTFLYFVDPIAFNVYNRQQLTMGRNTPTNVVYDAVYYNHGNAYNPVSGIFTAPSSGMYVFTWSSCVASRKIFDAEILVNGNRKGLGNCNNKDGSGIVNCANTVPLVLETGDKVNIRTLAANHLYGNGWSSFKGWRVYELMCQRKLK